MFIIYYSSISTGISLYMCYIHKNINYILIAMKPYSEGTKCSEVRRVGAVFVAVNDALPYSSSAQDVF